MIQDTKKTINQTFKQNYRITETLLEKGTPITLPIALKDRDNISYDVASINNEVCWSTKITLDQEANQIDKLLIQYTGKASILCNPIEFSIYNHNTKNWENVATIPLTTLLETKQIILPSDLSRFITSHRDIKLRLYNFASSSFIRQTDHLQVTVFCHTEKEVEKCLPKSVIVKSGILIEKDENLVTIASDINKKAILQMIFPITTSVKKIHTLTVTQNTSVLKTNAAGSIILSLYNYQTNTFINMQTTINQEKEDSLSFTMIDQLEISQYLSSEGELILQIDNASCSAFTRSFDYGELLIEISKYESFTIAQLSDIHELIGHTNFLTIINDINTNSKPDFTIITGDVTDHGTPEQFALYCQDSLNFEHPLYTLPGNHDTRWWNSNGKNDYQNHLGPLFQSFNYQGIHFVLLDTTVNFEIDEKINKAQLEWLVNDLSQLPDKMPIIFFGHHPFRIHNNVTGRDELLKIAKNYNCIGYLSGHMHDYCNFIENGIPIINITYVKDNNNQEYCTIHFTSRSFYLEKHLVSTSSKELWLVGSMENIRKTTFIVDSLVVSDNGNVTITIHLTDTYDDISHIQARIDNYGPYTSLTNTKYNTWQATIDISKYSPFLPHGKHFVGVEVFDGKGQLWSQYINYEYVGGQIGTNWIYETNDLIQSTPTYYDGTIYVGSYDHQLYALDENTGLVTWCYQTGDSIISKPVIYHNNSTHYVLFGSNDQNLYCLQAKTGKLVWYYPTGGSVMSDPIIHENIVIFGSGDGFVYAINVINGELVWSYQVEGLMRQQPLVQEGILYAFVRNTFLWYALNVTSGTLIWRGNANTNESYFVCGDIRPIIAGGKLWCIDAQNTRFSHLDIKTGVLVWTDDSFDVSSRGMATDGIYVYYVSHGGRIVHALDASTKQKIWSLDLRANSSDDDLQSYMIDSAIIYDEGCIIHVSERGRITIINADSGTILYCYDAVGYPERVFWSTPEVANHKIFISGIDGGIYCISYPKE